MNANKTTTTTPFSWLEYLDHKGRLWSVLEHLHGLTIEELKQPEARQNLLRLLQGWEDKDNIPYSGYDARQIIKEYLWKYHLVGLNTTLPENRAVEIQRQQELFSFLPEPTFTISEHQRVRLGAVQFTQAYTGGNYMDCRVIYTIEELRNGYWRTLTSIGQAAAKNLHNAFVVEYNTHPEDWSKVYPPESNVVLFYPKNLIYIKEYR